MKKYIMGLFTMLLLFGCSNMYEEAVEKANRHFKNEEYTEALAYYEKALEEKADKEISSQVDHIHSFEELNSYIDKDKWEKADSLVQSLSEEALKTPLAESVKDKEEQVSVAVSEIDGLESNLDEIEKLLEKKELENIEDLLQKVQDSEYYDVVGERFDQVAESFVKTEKRIEEEKRHAEEKAKEEEEARLKAEAEAQAKKEEEAKEKQANLVAEKAGFLKRFEALEKEQEGGAEGSSTLHMRESIWERTEPWDEELNKAYQLIIENHPDAENIKAEQRQWLDEMKKEADEIFASSAEWGTIKQIESDSYIYSETMDRAKELVNKYMN